MTASTKKQRKSYSRLVKLKLDAENKIYDYKSRHR